MDGIDTNGSRQSHQVPKVVVANTIDGASRVAIQDPAMRRRVASGLFFPLLQCSREEKEKYPRFPSPPTARSGVSFLSGRRSGGGRAEEPGICALGVYIVG